MSTGGSTRVVLAALACNLAVAVAKFAAAGWTGSSAMLSEAIHSLAAASSQALLLAAVGRDDGPAADAHYPSRYARELCFWSFIVAILLYAAGAGIALHEGIARLADPRPVASPEVNYAVIAVAMLLQCLVTWKALAEFGTRHGKADPLSALRASNEPALLTIVLESLAAMAGLAAALAGVAVTHATGNPAADAVASLVIGLVLAAVAVLMCVEARRIVVGEPATRSGPQGLGAIPAADVRASPARRDDALSQGAPGPSRKERKKDKRKARAR